jgi:hypothetical protein
MRLLISEGDDLRISLVHKRSIIAYPLGFISYSRREIGLSGRHYPWVGFGNEIDRAVIDVLESGVQAKILECLVEYSVRLR